MAEDAMFAESLLETSWAQRSRRSWMTLTSFGLQTVIISLLLLAPLLRTVGVPSGRLLPTPVSWGALPPAPPPATRQHIATVVQSNLADNVLIAPRDVPQQVAMLEESVPPPQVSFDNGGVDGGVGGDSRSGVWKSLNDSIGHASPPPVLSPGGNRPFHISKMLEGSLTQRIQPAYPPLARAARVQGQVVLAAIISKTGTIENLQVISGHPMLVKAALDAVSQWRYRPYILNNEPVEVETQIMVNFTLGN